MVEHSIIAARTFALLAMTVAVGCIGNEDVAGFDELESSFDSAALGQVDPADVSVVIANSLAPSALVPTDLGIHSLSNMSAATASSLRSANGASLRDLLEYAVGCALDVGDNFEFFWFDANGVKRQESYNGALGLARAWRNRALNVPEQHAVSACLAARTNWYEEPLSISQRGGLSRLSATADEINRYRYREGAFWGNLFGPTPYLQACYEESNVEYARARHRDCAAGHVESDSVVDCGMIAIVGSCQETCIGLTAGGYYFGCSARQEGLPPDVSMHLAVTVFLE
ncbi:MAG TPA: hypothetical protein PK156_41765 [Polyangium sp.]|nr:hypothetical protein [Polyangium sp.]